MTATVLNLTTPASVDASRRSLWRPPLSTFNDQALARYYWRRGGARFFPVADPEQTRREVIDAVLANVFRFNGKAYRLAEPIDWADNPSTDLEWHVLLYKFYYAVGLGMAYRDSGERRYLQRWVALTESWIEHAPADFCANPALRAEASQVTGRRVQNWIYAYHYFVADADKCAVPADFHRRFLCSLHDQVEYLCAHLSPARNHRTLELAAIFLAAVTFPEFRAAAGWLNLASEQIANNIRDDLLADGVHCELSTDYHHLVLKNYLGVCRLAQLNGVRLPPDVDRRLVKALEFSLYAHKPDGVVPALSDGDARDFRELLAQGGELYRREDLRYAASFGEHGTPPAARSRAFPDGGYYVLRSGWGEREAYRDERYLIFDCGPLGQGNHGHLDGLSVELAAFGRSLVVDPGRYTYHEPAQDGDAINWRVRFRSTACHNTVLVDGKNQTRYGPKLGKARYKIQGPAPDCALQAFVSEPGFDYLHGVARSHEYDAVHQRRIFFVAGEYWIIADTLDAEHTHDYTLSWQLSEHAQNNVDVRVNDDTRVAHTPQLLVAQCATPRVTLQVEPGQVSYRYGEKQSAPVLRFHQRAARAVFLTVLYPYRRQPPRLSLKPLAVSTEPAKHGASAFRVTLEQHGWRRSDVCFFADPGVGCRTGFGGYQFDGAYLLAREGERQTPLTAHASRGARLSHSATTFEQVFE